MSETIRALLLLVSVGVLAVFGLFVARWTVSDGVDRFRADPVEYAVAGMAYDMAWIHHDNPIQRALMPAARVVEVTRRPGHCTDPNPGPRYTDYTARVRFYTFFGLPADVAYISCGGWGVSSSRPAAWDRTGQPTPVAGVLNRTRPQALRA